MPKRTEVDSLQINSNEFPAGQITEMTVFPPHERQRLEQPTITARTCSTLWQPKLCPHFLLAQRSFPRFHFEGMCARAHLHVVGLLWFYVKDFNQPSLPTPFYAVLVSVSVFMALSTVFHSINSPDNSPLFSLCSSGLNSALLVLKLFVFFYESFSQSWYNPLWLTELRAPTN